MAAAYGLPFIPGEWSLPLPRADPVKAPLRRVFPVVTGGVRFINAGVSKLGGSRPLVALAQGCLPGLPASGTH